MKLQAVPQVNGIEKMNNDTTSKNKLKKEYELISVIVPVYQAVDTLKRCVSSILAQTYTELEIILIDDGAQDGSGKLCDELQQADLTNRIKVRHSANKGVSHARNLGMEMAQGEWIAFADADDTLRIDCLQQMIQAAEGNTTELIAQTDRIFCGKQGRPAAENVDNRVVVSGNYFLENAILNSDTHVWGKLYRKNLIGDLLFPEQLAIGEDMLFLLQLALTIGQHRQICCIPEGGYLYTENVQGAMNQAYKQSYLDQIFCWRQAEMMILEQQRELSPYVYTKLATIQIMAAMLVAGKAACAKNLDKAALHMALDLCRDTIHHALSTNGAFAGLSTGYKLKVILFQCNKDCYLRLYGKWKNN